MGVVYITPSAIPYSVGMGVMHLLACVYYTDIIHLTDSHRGAGLQGMYIGETQEYHGNGSASGSEH